LFWGWFGGLGVLGGVFVWGVVLGWFWGGFFFVWGFCLVGLFLCGGWGCLGWFCGGPGIRREKGPRDEGKALHGQKRLPLSPGQAQRAEDRATDTLVDVINRLDGTGRKQGSAGRIKICMPKAISVLREGNRRLSRYRNGKAGVIGECLNKLPDGI